MLRLSLASILVLSLLTGCDRPRVDLSELEAEVDELQLTLIARRQGLSELRNQAAMLDREREQLAKDLRVAQETSDEAEDRLLAMQQAHGLGENSMPIVVQPSARGLELGDVQIKSLVFRHAVVTDWDRHLLTFKHDEGTARVVITDAPPSVQAKLRDARPTADKQQIVAVNVGDVRAPDCKILAPRPKTRPPKMLARRSSKNVSLAARWAANPLAVGPLKPNQVPLPWWYRPIGSNFDAWKFTTHSYGR